MSLVFVSILCNMGWSLVSHSQSSSIRDFQQIETRLSKLFITKFAVKMMEFQWYCLSRANGQRLGIFYLIWSQGIFVLDLVTFYVKFNIEEAASLQGAKVMLKWFGILLNFTMLSRLQSAGHIASQSNLYDFWQLSFANIWKLVNLFKMKTQLSLTE